MIDRADNIPLEAVKKINRAAVVVQSTQTLKNVEEILAALRPHIPELQFKNTICRATRVRQQDMETLPLENDVVLVIGSKTSANTKRLYELSKTLNKNTCWIQSADDIQREWFRGAETVGITAGASTPDFSIKSVVRCLEEL